MKFCPEDIRLSSVEAIEELLLTVVGDGAIRTSDKRNKGKVHATGCNHVVGFFERKLVASDQEMRVFIPVYAHLKNTAIQSKRMN